MPKVREMLAHGSNEDVLSNREGARRKGHPKINVAISKNPVKEQRNCGDPHCIAHTKTPTTKWKVCGCLSECCEYKLLLLVDKAVSVNGQEKYS